MVRGIVNLYERAQVRLFVRRDPFRRFYSCLVYVPRDRYNTQARERIEKLALEAFGGTAIESQVTLSESVLARLHMLVRTPPDSDRGVDAVVLERRITETVRTWQDQLKDSLLDAHGEAEALRLYRTWGEAFPAAYQEDTPFEVAVDDIGALERVVAEPSGLHIALYRRKDQPSHKVQFKLLRKDRPIPISDVLPTIENLGLKLISERPYEIGNAPNAVWIQDFELEHPRAVSIDLATDGPRLKATFARVWTGEADNDGFNRLVLAADLGWREAAVLRTYARWFGQLGLLLSQAYIEEALASNAAAAGHLLHLFIARFDPALSRAESQARGRHAPPRARAAARRRHAHRRRPDPARLPVRDRRDAAHQLFPHGCRRRAAALPRAQARPAAAGRSAAAEADVRDLRALAARRGRAPAHGPRRARRAALVGPPRRLPHRDPRPHEGAERQEHGDRAGRRQGRLRAAPPARRPRRGAGRRHRMLPLVHPRAARRDRQRERRQGRAARCGRALRRRRPLPRRRRRQGHGEVLRRRKCHLRGIRLLARRRIRLGRLGRLRPQGHGHHGARRLGVRAPAFPRSRPRHAVAGLHGRRHRRHVGRRIRQCDAALAAHPAGRGVRPPPHLHRPVPGRGAELHRAQAHVRPAPLELGGLRQAPAVEGRRRPLAPRQDGHALRGGARPARHRRRLGDAGRGGPRDPEAARGPALERRHRHLRQVGRGNERRDRRPRQ